jgi:alpha-tubulin suppressor-like RCC1 family protein
MIQTEYSNILKKIAVENGKEIFLEPKRLKPFLSDYTKNEYRKENAFLMSVLNTDCIKYINNAQDLAECKKFLLRRLDDEYGLSPAKSAEMLDILFLALRGANVKPLDETRKNIARFQKCIALGYDPKSSHIVGLKADGTVAAVGSNEKGQCNTQSWRDVTAVYAGSELTIGLKSDGTLLLEGGLGSIQSNSKGVIMASIGFKYFALLSEGGFVATIGNNDYGRCDTENWRDITAVSAGMFYTVGLRGDGTVVAVGNNDDGQCETSGWRDIVGISAGYNHTVAVKADGTVVAVGNNRLGQCKTHGWRDIAAVSAGMLHTIGLKADGTVVVTGSNDYGQCNVQFWKDYIAVCAGLFNTVGLKADGTVVVCGENKFCQCDTQGWQDIGVISEE